MRRAVQTPDREALQPGIGDASAGPDPQGLAELVPAGETPQAASAGALPDASVRSIDTRSDPYLAIIERAARDPAVDLAKLEGLMGLRERMEDRRAKQAFDNAIALAKGEIGPIVKNRAVDFTSEQGPHELPL